MDFPCGGMNPKELHLMQFPAYLSLVRLSNAHRSQHPLAIKRYFIAEPMLVDGDKMPTRKEWLEEQKDKAVDSPSVGWGAIKQVEED
jgi:hypothetical protein